MTSQFPGGEMPGMAAMSDTLSFVKKLWGGMQVPGMIAPTVSIDDLDKKIKDLKTVESWLNVNMNMLRGTIQALEVQRATIATLNSLGASFSNAMNTPAASPFAEPAAAAADTQPKAVNPEWPMPPSSAAPTQAVAEPEERVEEEAEEVEPAADGKPEQSAQYATPEDASASQFVNPAAWWTLLQDQFKQAVSNAMAGELTGSRPVDETPAAAVKKTAAKPAVKTAPKSTTKRVEKTASKQDAKVAVATKKTPVKTSGKQAATAKASASKTKAAPAAAPRRVTPKA
ncbi:PhaM family polyhydroxyalkanoate granule multifunctional regulatory protein [Undibacterium sp.]|uniref:PhaM family polyhydroxyalkanoate granule multifunctional regulatory protein n=1 Tax=Undibacterium sp. TaxID=1914977 RepID=UPI00374D45B4